jgi:hypothetical protein
MTTEQKYYHEIPASELDAVIADGKTWGHVLENYKQPDWCEYPEALNGIWGCWSLTDNSPDGLRTKISEQYCSTCEYCKNKVSDQSTLKQPQ